jgi:pimeloyl-ACP methyl ester carboxylesterase
MQKVARSISTPVRRSAPDIHSDVPLVFLHGMKGSHLSTTSKNKHWLSLSGLLNFPPKSDFDASRDLSLPLTYTGSTQDRGNLEPDGLVNYIVDINATFLSLKLLPFYGHISQYLKQVNDAHHIKSVGNSIGAKVPNVMRPTSCFIYDWRRDLTELAEDFHQFCCTTFPDSPVQVLAHSMGGLISLSAMRKYPDKYRPGAVMVGVPFGTGIQYLQDLNLGYFSEIGRCRQFLPESQFTFSSHWCFFPTSPESLEDSFVDVTHIPNFDFKANVPSIGKGVKQGLRELPIEGKRIDINFYSVEDWERHKLGIFGKRLDDDVLKKYRNHMRLEMARALKFRSTVLRPEETEEDIPPLVVGATNTIPTINQILRKLTSPKCFDYDYSSGRAVPGDGRINFSGAFPPVKHKKFKLQSLHAKQFLWKEHGGDLENILHEVNDQLHIFLSSRHAL